MPLRITARGNGQQTIGVTKVDHLELGWRWLALRPEGTEDFPARVVHDGV